MATAKVGKAKPVGEAKDDGKAKGGGRAETATKAKGGGKTETATKAKGGGKTETATKAKGGGKAETATKARGGSRAETATKAKGGGKPGGGAPATSKGRGLEAAVKKAIESVRAIRAELERHDLASLTSDDRQHSAGKLRHGEGDAMVSVLDAVDAHPGQFTSLAPHDKGVDDATVETGPSRAALARRALLEPLAAELEALMTRVNDDMLASAELAKDVTKPAYAIIRANAPINPALRKSASSAINFYAKQARRRGTKKPGEP